MKSMRFSRGVMFCLLLVAVCLPGLADSTKPDLVILHVNDTHGRMLSGDRDGEGPGCAPRLATMVAEHREAYPERVLAMHAGDIFSKAGPLTRHTGGAANMRVMNAIGFDVFAPGNGEFYFGIRNMIRNQGIAQFPIVHATALYTHNGHPAFSPFIVRRIDGLRVGILGLGVVRMNDAIARDIAMGDPIEEAQKYLPELRKRSDIVVVLSHLGNKTDQKLAVELPGIDLIVGGHSHTVVKEPLALEGKDGRPVFVTQAGIGGEFLGRLALYLAEDRKRIERIDGELLSIDKSQPSSAEVRNLIAEERLALKQTICEFAAPISHDPEAEAVSPAQQFAADIVQDYFKTELGFFDTSIVRAGFEQGPFRAEDMAAVHPYRTDCLLMRLTGEQVQTLVAKNSLLAAGCVIERDAGEVSGVLINGAPLEGDKEYGVAMDAELYVMAKDLPEVAYLETGLRVDQVLAEVLGRKGTIRLSDPVVLPEN